MKKPTQHLFAEVPRKHSRTELTIGVDLGSAADTRSDAGWRPFDLEERATAGSSVTK